jgi:ABC-type glycerol-3-phosphate transport system substrate-binding protein
MRATRLTRRHFLATTAASGAAIAMPRVRHAHAAGKLAIGFWDHWVPGANNTMTALVNEWAAKEKVETTIDYITSQGNKNLLTIAAEAQSRTGHDILAFPTWQPAEYARLLEPVTDVMEPLIKQNGAVNQTVEYLGRAGGQWLAVPATTGSQIKGPCSRIDLMKRLAGVDMLRCTLPAARLRPRIGPWTCS